MNGIRKSNRGKSDTALKAPSPPSYKPIATVGIGASAGGLEAIKEVLQALPPDTGMAFVVVQHLEARHESMLTTILSNATKMPIAEIKDGVHVEANHVYVIPPNSDIRLAGGILRLTLRKPPRGRHLPIDDFFLSLSQDQGTRAVGVILSGTASDGTLGLRAIKAEGGITIAPEPETAKFDGMPANAIASGCVDFVLPPNGIARELTEISRQPYIGLSKAGEAIAIVSARDEEWFRVFEILKAASGVDFTFYKKPTIKRRIARRMALHKVEQLSGYLKKLDSDPSEIDALYQDILIHVTNFFREPDVFQAFQRKILPRILGGKAGGEAFRIWCAGCSTGEEVYSLAICLLESLAKRRCATPLMIFGSDVSEQAIEKARKGIYSEAALSEMTPERRRRFFTKVNGNYQVNTAVRDVCVFARHDLSRDPPFSRMDLISCRNVLIYLEPVLQKRVLASFHYALKPTGFLLLGRSETMGGFSDLFTIVDRKNKFFTRKVSAGVVYEVGPFAPARSLPSRKDHPEPAAGGADDLEKQADRLVWENYGHAGLVVDSDLQILHFRGDTSPYLRPVPGKATFHLLRMLRDELVFELRAAIEKVRRTGASVRRDSIRIKNGKNDRSVSMNVFPLSGSSRREKSFLVVFDEVDSSDAGAAEPKKASKAELRETVKLKSELARTREYLQATMQDQESTNEELKTANEEALSGMEELQSANEELETAKEELQSSNEELVTLNEQMQNRNAELTHITDDLSNVFSSVKIPILMLGDDCRIRRFTPTAEHLLNLMPGDIGRPIRNIRLGLEVPGLDDLISKVKATGIELHQEVKGPGDKWYSVRLFPYRTKDQRIDGILLAFVDIHDLKRGEADLRLEVSLSNAILDASANDLLVVVLDAKGRIVRFNRACHASTGYAFEDVRGKYTWDFLVPADDIELARASFDQARIGPVRNDYHWCTKDGRTMLISWSNVATITQGAVDYVVCTGIDVTERMEIRQQVREKHATVHALLESATQAIVAFDERGHIVLANAAAEATFGYDREELKNLTVDKLLPEDLRPPDPLYYTESWPDDNQDAQKRASLVARHKNGTTFSVEVTSSQIQTRSGVLDVCFVSDITDRMRRESAMLDYQKQLQSLASRLLSVQESENRIVARELHDDLSQRIAALGFEISVLPKEVEETPEILTERVRDLGHRIGSLAEDVHRMSRHLHPEILDDLGLSVALREECMGFSARLGVPVHFQASDVPASVPSDISLCLFRVAQESLRNIGRHADAREVQVNLATAGRELVLTINDVGDGFDLDEASGKGGLGLISMEERVKLVHGDFTIHSQLGDGTRIEVRVPLETASS